MNWKYDEVQERSLRPARSEEEYLLHEAALEWSLADSIVIQAAEDIQSRSNWRDRLEPYHHQVQNLITFCRRLPVVLLADDVGLGKTISAGLILSELMVRKRVSRALVLCPKILCPQWVEELAAKFGIVARIAVGQDLDNELKGSSPVIVTTYQSASNRLTNIEAGSFDMLVLDEAHKLRNLHGSTNSPLLATAVRAALERRLFKFVVMLTATPIQNRVWDLYSLIDCLTAAKGHTNPLGSPHQFKADYLMSGNNGRRLDPQNAEKFRRVLRQYIVRTRRGDARLQFPSREVRLVRVDLTPKEVELTRLVAAHIGGLNALQQTSLAQALMSSPQALAAQLDNMGFLPAVATQARAVTEPAKLKRLLILCDELRSKRPSDWRVVVFTLRRETLKAIGEALSHMGIPAGFVQGGKARENQISIERFRRNPPEVHALVSTDAGAEGVNLQAANVLVNFDLPWNPMVVEQRIGRLQRLASQHATVVICNMVAADSVEERVVARLMEKLQLIAHAVGDIESVLESSGWEGDEERFETQVREMVVRSLMGQDVERVTQLAKESIDKARRQIEEQGAEMDQTLGRLDELHQSGPHMPRLERIAPSLPARDFVLLANLAEGGTVVEKSPGLYEAKVPGRPDELIAFDEPTAEAMSSQAVFMGKVRLFQPGKTEFERLVKHWVDRCGHHVLDLRRLTDAQTEELARSWCETVPGGCFLACQVTERETKFQGRIRVKIKATNGVDGYEKLLTSNFHPAGHQGIRATANLPGLPLQEARLSEMLPGCTARLKREVEADRDVAAFCRFYEERRVEELAKAGCDARLRHKINEDFTPSIASEIAGFHGAWYDEVWLQLQFSVNGAGRYEANLRAVPAASQLLEEPERKECGQTGLRFPVGCLEECQPNGAHVLRHLLEKSEETGRWVRRDQLVTCQITGKKVCEDEVARSAVSGITGLKSAFVECQHTGDWILQSEAVWSDLSGKAAKPGVLQRSEKPPGRHGLPAEFGVCEFTGQRLLLDELGQCVLTRKSVAVSHLNAKGELIPLRELLDGRSQEAVAADDLLAHVSPLAEALFRRLPGLTPVAEGFIRYLPGMSSLVERFSRHLNRVWVVRSPGARNLAVCGEVGSCFGKRVEYIGFLLKTEPAIEVSGQAVIGARGKGGWKLEKRTEPGTS